MSEYLLDTNLPSELTRPRPSTEVLSWLSQAEQADLFISAVSIVELMRGIERHPDAVRKAKLRKWFRGPFREWFSTEVLPLNEPIAELAGSLQASEESRGRILSFPDAAIAATAMYFGLTLVTRNVKHFEGLGITLMNPWNDSVGAFE